MSDDHNRGAYTPQSDAPLAFDARHSRGPGERPLPVTLIVSGVVLLLLVIGGIIFVMRGASSDPTAPAATQSIDAMKTATPEVQEAKPVEQQGIQIGYTEGQPMPIEPGTNPPAAGNPNFTARPEAPVARPAPGTAPALPAPVVVNQALPTKAGPTVVTPPAAALPKVAPVEAKPVAKVEAKPAPKVEAKPEAKAEVRPAASGSPQVQIGAFSSDALAEQSWNGVASKIPGRIAGKTLHVEKADVGGKTYHRALVGGFTSRADADSFCSALKAQGGDCSVR
jgi:cell division protein FtsN